MSTCQPIRAEATIENSELCQPRTDDVDSDSDVDHLFACYNTVQLCCGTLQIV